MAPLPPNQNPALDEDFADKTENGCFAMPQTPKTAVTVTSPRADKPQGLARFATQSVHLRECFAEFLGTFIMILFGMGLNNQVTNSADANGTWLSWGIGVLIGVYSTEGVSGAHMNTAVTLAHAVYGRLPWWKVPGYMISQVLGAFVDAFFIYVMQYQNLNVVDPNRESITESFARLYNRTDPTSLDSSNGSQTTAFHNAQWVTSCKTSRQSGFDLPGSPQTVVLLRI